MQFGAGVLSISAGSLSPFGVESGEGDPARIRAAVGHIAGIGWRWQDGRICLLNRRASTCPLDRPHLPLLEPPQERHLITDEPPLSPRTERWSSVGVRSLDVDSSHSQPFHFLFSYVWGPRQYNNSDSRFA